MAVITCAWSGGIDSTALIAQLLKAGHVVKAFALDVYGGAFAMREFAARVTLLPKLKELGDITYYPAQRADWIWAFSPDGVEIPRRNRHIIDHLVTSWRATNIGLGEYIGADTWVVQDHVGAADADSRALAAYIYHEYGLSVRLWTLSDFGEARYKHNRLKLGVDAGIDMTLTTNCLTDNSIHCGACYKCIERSVAFAKLGLEDSTRYATDPRKHPAWSIYDQQMSGLSVTLPANTFAIPKLPKKA
jgi:hypothetical protein